MRTYMSELVGNVVYVYVICVRDACALWVHVLNVGYACAPFNVGMYVMYVCYVMCVCVVCRLCVFCMCVWYVMLWYVCTFVLFMYDFYVWCVCSYIMYDFF